MSLSSQELVFALEERLRASSADDDPGPLRGEEAEQQAHKLFYEVDWLAPLSGAESAQAFNIARALAPFHFWRFLHDDGKEDLSRATFLYRMVRQVAPHLVPEGVEAAYRQTGEEEVAAPTPAVLSGYTALGVNLLKQAEATGDPRLLDDAVEWCLLAAGANPQRDVVWAESLITLGNVLTRRYEYTGRGIDLDRAHDVTVQAAAAIPEGDPCRLKACSGFGHLGIRLFQRDGDLDTLLLAINALREAAYGAPEEYEHRAALLTNLNSALTAWYGHTGLAEAADEALEVQREAVRITPPDHPDLASRLVNLAGGLAGAAHRGDAEDGLVDEAVAVLRGTLRLVPDGHPDRPDCLRLLAGVLRGRYDRHGDPQDLTDAAAASRSAVQAGGAPAYLRPRLLRDHASTLRVLAEHTEVPDTAGAPGAPGVPGAAGAPGTAGVLAEALEAVEEAVRLLPDDHPELTETLTTLGLLLRARSRADGSAADLTRAVAELRRGAAVPLAPARARALAAASAGRFAAEAGDFAGATGDFALALTQLELTAWRGLERSDQERLLAGFPNLVSDAAACAVRAGVPERAVELVEQGRGILLAQALEARTDHRELLADAPEFVEELMEILTELDTLSGARTGPGAAGIETRRRAHDRRRILTDERDKLLARIRALPGHERFLLSPSFADLRTTARSGPVVLLTAGTFGCQALVLTGEGVQAVPLRLTVEELAEQAVDLLRALGGDPSPLEARGAVVASLAWLWRTVTEPVLRALGLGPIGADSAWPRLWWCPTGLFTLFPLHAAGVVGNPEQGTAPDAVVDRVVSSYTPTLRVLLHARARQRPEPAPGAATSRLIVSLPSTPGRQELPAAAEEARSLLRRYPDAHSLTGRAATTSAVLEALTGASWAHFACHGAQDLAKPSRAALELYDGPLTLWDLASLRLPHAELAFLSACETSRGGAVLADEAISLAAGVQLAGFRHVIGTLWSIDDGEAHLLAERVYESLTTEGGQDRALDPAAALHSAIRAARAENPHAVLHWAPYVHVGP